MVGRPVVEVNSVAAKPAVGGGIHFFPAQPAWTGLVA